MLEIFQDIQQGTDEWLRARIGVPTASEFGCLLAKGKDGGESKTRKSYLYRLASEIITGEPIETFKGPAMERGNRMEDEARNFYAFAYGAEPEQVGFIRNGQKGCSPDSLIGANGMLEIKTQRGDLLLQTLEADKFPSEHVPQCQGALWVAEREWIDICVYWPGMETLVKRAYRDEPYIKRLEAAVQAFNEELAMIVDRHNARRRAA